METLASFFTIVGVIDAIVLIVGIIVSFVLWSKGILPVLYRLGNGLARRKIALFAKGDHLASLKALLLDSKLFCPKNIQEVTQIEDIGRAEGATVYVVQWGDWAMHIDEILLKKTDRCALIVYAPRSDGPIAPDMFSRLDGERNTAVSNFRGRLMSDIIASMITTSYVKN